MAGEVCTAWPGPSSALSRPDHGDRFSPQLDSPSSEWAVGHRLHCARKQKVRPGGASSQRGIGESFLCGLGRSARRRTRKAHRSSSSGLAPSPIGSAPKSTSESVSEAVHEAGSVSCVEEVGGLGTAEGVGGVAPTWGGLVAGCSMILSSQAAKGMPCLERKCALTQAI